MAREVFVDTSAWYAALRSTVPEHTTVVAHLRRLIEERYRIVTTNLVVAETHALLLRRVGRVPALTFVRTVAEPPNLVVVSTRDLETKAVEDWLERFEDQAFSFTDAVSFAAMRERRIRSALALDKHFAAAGFEVLP